MVNYFKLDEIGRAMYKKRMARNLEDMYFHLISVDEFEGTLVDFIDQTEQDMKAVENYEGLAALQEIRKQKGWL